MFQFGLLRQGLAAKMPDRGKALRYCRWYSTYRVKQPAGLAWGGREPLPCDRVYGVSDEICNRVYGEYRG